MDIFEKLMHVYERMRSENGEPQEQPPISAFAVRIAFEGLGLPMHPALARLYQWHNGIWYLNAFLSLLTLGEAVKTYRSYAQARDSGRMDIKASWFPIFDQNGDYQYCIDLTGTELWRVDLEDGSTQLLARNYESFLDALVAAFDRGAAVFDAYAGHWDVADETWMDLCVEFGLETDP